VLALYAFAVFGYLAATLSSFFIERDGADDQAELVGARSINELRKQVAGLQADLEHSWSAQSARELSTQSDHRI
jgi:voltage-gated potassium channel